MQFDSANALLVIIDVQGNLALRMSDKEPLFLHISALIKAAQALDMPVVVTEQAPDKLGATIPQIADQLPSQIFISKLSFSCWKEPAFQKQIKKHKRTQIILCGIETHVCVVQTAMDLIGQNYSVQVVEDAVSSRKDSDKKTAIQRLRQKGADITSTEMIVTELLKSAAHPKFKEILQLIR